MHPFPCRPEAERGPGHQQRRGRRKRPVLKVPVEPAADDEAEQRRHDDRPAENADLAEPAPSDGSGSSRAFALALDGSSGGARRCGRCRSSRSRCSAPPRPVADAGWAQIAQQLTHGQCMQAGLLDARLASAIDALRARRVALCASRSASESPSTPSRHAMVTLLPSDTVKTPPRTAQKCSIAVGCPPAHHRGRQHGQTSPHDPAGCRSCRSRPRRATPR